MGEKAQQEPAIGDDSDSTEDEAIPRGHIASLRYLGYLMAALLVVGFLVSAAFGFTTIHHLRNQIHDLEKSQSDSANATGGQASSLEDVQRQVSDLRDQLCGTSVCSSTDVESSIASLQSNLTTLQNNLRDLQNKLGINSLGASDISTQLSHLQWCVKSLNSGESSPFCSSP